MSIYTKNGDRGTTDLVRQKNIVKSDDRIVLLGALEELDSHLRLLGTMLREPANLCALKRTQEVISLVAGGISDPYSHDFRLGDEETKALEEEIDRLAALCSETEEEGESRLSAQIRVARAVARRAESAFSSVSVKFGTDTGAKRWLNRLCDYLQILSRYEAGKDRPTEVSADFDEKAFDGPERKTSVSGEEKVSDLSPSLQEAVVQEVVRRIGAVHRITLSQAKALLEQLEAEAVRRGMKAVFAICTPEGQPVAVHCMDGAFLVSFDVAVKKAYTACAVRMSTKELSALAQPGETFYGVDKAEGIILIGGGVPLKVGETIVGGLGVSGGTGEADHSLAMAAQEMLAEIL